MGELEHWGGPRTPGVVLHSLTVLHGLQSHTQPRPPTGVTEGAVRLPATPSGSRELSGVLLAVPEPVNQE